jgi:hypothetical protein
MYLFIYVSSQLGIILSKNQATLVRKQYDMENLNIDIYIAAKFFNSENTTGIKILQ